MILQLLNSATRPFYWIPQRILKQMLTCLVKRNLVRCLADRARRICTSDTIDDELTFLLDSLVSNGYPTRFVKIHLGARTKLPRLPTAEKKTLYLSLPFKSDEIADVVKRRLTNAVNATYFRECTGGGVLRTLTHYLIIPRACWYRASHATRTRENNKQMNKPRVYI